MSLPAMRRPESINAIRGEHAMITLIIAVLTAIAPSLLVAKPPRRRSRHQALRFLPVIAVFELVVILGSTEPLAQNAYITSGFGTVSAIATATNMVTARIPVSSYTFGVAVTPDGSKAYVANYGSNTVSVIATTTNTVINTIPVAAGPVGVAVTPDGSKVYVGDYLSVAVTVIATATNTVTATTATGSQPEGVAVSPDGNKVYFANPTSNTVSVIATANNSVIATIPVGSYPIGVAVSPDGSNIYITNNQSNTVSVIAPSTRTSSARCCDSRTLRLLAAKQ